MADLIINRLLTNKSSIGESKIDEVTANYSLADGDVVFKINHLAMTTNNITYAAFGEAMQYWNFFPTHTEGWGHMPAWGFANVIASETPDIAVGERFYGYFPITSHLIMRPERIGERGFYDGAAHRAELTSVYNQYTRCSADTGYAHKTEYHQSLLKPLYITAYMLADFLADNDMFAAEQLVMSSASSKTAYGTAYCLKKDHPSCRLIALTSSSNIDFVKSLDLYDEVLPYSRLENIQNKVKTAYVDFSGNENLRSEIHTHIGTSLTYDCLVGTAQHTNFVRNKNLPGPRVEFFFAPNQISKRNKDYGSAELSRRMAASLTEFIAFTSASTPPIMYIEEHSGLEQTCTLIKKLYAGECSPAAGNVIIL